jgi:uncharacterized surface protein with fasciclin (FAS1) repeats
MFTFRTLLVAAVFTSQATLVNAAHLLVAPIAGTETTFTTAARPVGLHCATTAVSSAALLRQTPELRRFSRLLTAARLHRQISNPAARTTAFAPTSAAFASISASIQQRLFVPGSVGLAHVMNSHLVAGDVDLLAVPNGTVLTTFNGESLRVDRQADGSVLLNGVYRVTQGYTTATGRVYMLDLVINPVGTPMPDAVVAQQ